MITENLNPQGNVEIIVEENKNGFIVEKDRLHVKNAVLKTGREALAKCLSNSFGNSFNLFIDQMLFGDGGTSGGAIKFVNSERNGLFGITRAAKPVIATLDPTNPSLLILTSVLAFGEANGYAINEIALKLNSGDLYSMATLADLNKTSSLQLTFNWRISFI